MRIMKLLITIVKNNKNYFFLNTKVKEISMVNKDIYGRLTLENDMKGKFFD